MQTYRILFVLFLFLVGFAKIANAAEPSADSFKIYWQEFHQAFVAKDFGKLQSLSAPVITIRGVVDGIKPKKIQAKDFEKTLAAIMETSVREYQGEKLVSLTTYEKVKALANPKLDESPNRQWIDDFVFTKERTGWKLKEIYWEELE
jgi:hypothetical protein